MNTVKDERELLAKPGDTIVETLEYIKMSQAELAKRIGKTPSKINDIISGKEPITVATALQLEKALGIDAQFWLNHEINYREKLVRIEQEEALQSCIEWLNQQPIRELQKQGYIKSNKVGTAMVAECLQFYGVDTPVQWQSMYVNDYAKTSFRRSDPHSNALGSMAAWLRIGELGLRQMNLPEYDKDKFKFVLTDILKLVKEHPEDFAGQLQKLCMAVGVAIVYTFNLPKAPISGATRWISGQPLIQLTDRYKSNDQFWFTFYHEAGHILLHGKRDVFLEDFEGYETDVTKENEANDFSAEFLLPNSFLDEIADKEITEALVRKIARSYSTHPAIVVGRLQRLKKVLFSFGANFKMKVVLDPYILKK